MMFFGVDKKSPAKVCTNLFDTVVCLSPHTKLEYPTPILTVLEQFRYDIISFNGAKVHSLINVITMEKNMHEAFDRLLLYFEATVRLALVFSTPSWTS
jgi:hypothetical protein